MRRQWDSALKFFDIGAELSSDTSQVVCQLTPAGLRASGTAADYMDTGSFGRLKWECTRACAATLEHYGQLGTHHMIVGVLDGNYARNLDSN